MRIILCTQKDVFDQKISRMVKWEHTFPSWKYSYPDEPLFSEAEHWSVHYDFWLGSSGDKKEWTMAAIPIEDRPGGGDEQAEYEKMKSTCTTILVDPPDVNEESITLILFLIFVEIKKNNWISSRKIKEILKTIRFDEYLPAYRYFSGLPEHWLYLPAELTLSIEMSEGSCFPPPSYYNELTCDSLQRALEVLFGPRHVGLLFHYSLEVRNAIPFLAWDVDWPLSRRGKEPPQRRERVQVKYPWRYEPDQTILCIYQNFKTESDSPPAWATYPVIRLRVGGRTKEEAISNWHQCAKALRRMKPEDKRGKIL